MASPSPLYLHWLLDPEVDFLNHGSFGAAPRVVLEEQRRLRDALEHEPIRFLAPEREFEPKLDRVRDALAPIVGTEERDLVFVTNATSAVNAVLRSFPFAEGDEIVVTDHGYNACSNAARFVAERAGARVVVAEIPFPTSGPDEVVAAVAKNFTDRTRFVLIDHITSPTGLVLPVVEIAAAAHDRGARVMIDGAHAPGMLPLDIASIGADYYTGNCHKWLCAPKGCAFLWVRSELQDEVRPTVISHAANTPRPGRSRFMAEFDWTGTFDPTAWLALPAAIEFLDGLWPGGLAEHMAKNRALALEARRILAELLDVEAPAPEEMIGTLVTMPLPPGAAPPPGGLDPLQVRLFEAYRIEVPFVRWPAHPTRWFRVSAQAYNAPSQYRRLGEVLREELAATT